MKLIMICSHEVMYEKPDETFVDGDVFQENKNSPHSHKKLKIETGIRTHVESNQRLPNEHRANTHVMVWHNYMMIDAINYFVVCNKQT